MGGRHAKPERSSAHDVSPPYGHMRASRSSVREYSSMGPLAQSATMRGGAEAEAWSPSANPYRPMPSSIETSDIRNAKARAGRIETRELMEAAFWGRVDSARLRIVRGADVDAVDESGATALVAAAGNGHADIVRLLLERGADVDAHADESALGKAASNGHVEVARLLVEHGAKVDALGCNRVTPLIRAAASGHLNIVQFLVGRGADVDATDEDQMTPIMNAARNNHVDVVKYLAAAGADVNARNKEGDTAIRIAAKFGYQDVQNVLARLVPVARTRPTPNQTTQFERLEGGIAPVEVELLPTGSSDQGGGEYRAKWLDADAAVRFFFGDASYSSFIDEVRLWQRLRHPNVLKLYGACGAGELRFFVSEYASEGSLVDYVRSDRAKQTPWKFLHQAALGLAYLHERNIVHGNLRCSNILIGSDGVGKLANFTLSESTRTHPSNAPAFKGSMRWQAPEILRQSGNVRPSFASDVYSLGMCVLEAATKQRPWSEEQNDIYVAGLKCNWEPERADGYGEPRCPDEAARALVCRMCCCDPAMRPSLLSVVYELEAMAAQEQARLHDKQPEHEPEAFLTVESYRGGETCRLWSTLRDAMRKCSNPAQTDAFHELTRVFERLSTTPPGRAKVLELFHESVAELKELVAMTATQARVLQLSQTCATTNSLYTFRQRVRAMWRLLDEPPSVTEARCDQQRKRQIEFFVSEVSKTWLLLDELQSRDEIVAFLAFLDTEIANREARYSPGQVEVMRNARHEVAITAGDGLDALVSTAPEWFIAWYELEKDAVSMLGTGGFGSVHRAKWLDSEVVVKELLIGDSSAAATSLWSTLGSSSTRQESRPAAPMSPEAREKRAEALRMFRKEVDIWFTLRHPHVVELFGACHVGRPFFVCEFASNGTLPAYLQAHPGEMWARLRDAALGVQYLHARGVVHSDLKGNNVVVGRDRKAKVTDFGLSSVASQTDAARGKVTAAWHWVAPECLPDAGQRPEDASPPTFESDVYSLGMCVVEAMRAVEKVTDARVVPYPWQGMDNAVVKYHAKRGELPARPSSSTDAQWRLVERMCCLDPSRRIKISTVVDELEKLATGAQVEPADSVPYQPIPVRESDTLPPFASDTITASLTALRRAVSSEDGVGGRPVGHRAMVCSALKLLWEGLERVHASLAGSEACPHVLDALQALVDHARAATAELQLAQLNTFVAFAESALRVLALHRRLDKFVDANVQDGANASEQNERRERCEAVLSGATSKDEGVEAVADGSDRSDDQAPSEVASGLPSQGQDQRAFGDELSGSED